MTYRWKLFAGMVPALLITMSIAAVSQQRQEANVDSSILHEAASRSWSTVASQTGRTPKKIAPKKIPSVKKSPVIVKPMRRQLIESQPVRPSTAASSVSSSEGSISAVKNESSVGKPPASGTTASAWSPAPQPSTADLSLVISGPDVIPFETDSLYFLTIKNAGPARAQGISFQYTFSGVSTGTNRADVRCTQDEAGKIDCPTLSLEPGESRTLAFSLYVYRQGHSCGVTYGTHFFVGSTMADPHPQNNGADASFLMGCAGSSTSSASSSSPTVSTDLSVEASGWTTATKLDRTPPEWETDLDRGTERTYTFTVRNTGPSAAEDIQARFALPPYLSPPLVRLDPACVAGGVGWTSFPCATFRLEPGQSKAFSFVAAPEASSFCNGKLSTKFSVSAKTPDPAAANDAVVLTVNFHCPGGGISSSSSSSSPQLGKLLSITNANPDPDGSVVPIGIGPWAQFLFTAGGAAPVKIDTLYFGISLLGTNLDTQAFRIYNTADPARKQQCFLSAAANTVICNTDTIQNTINPASSATFALEANITSRGSITSGSRLHFFLNGLNPSLWGFLPEGIPSTRYSN